MTKIYRDFLGVEFREDDDGRVVGVLPPEKMTWGGHGLLHGGAIAGLLELTSAHQLRQMLAPGATFRPISVNVDYLRGGVLVETFATARIERIGSRVANVVATAWQDDPSRAIATARTIYSVRS